MRSPPSSTPPISARPASAGRWASAASARSWARRWAAPSWRYTCRSPPSSCWRRCRPCARRRPPSRSAAPSAGARRRPASPPTRRGAAPRPETGSGELAPEQPLGVAVEDCGAAGGVEVAGFDRIARFGDRPERRVAGEDDMAGAEEADAAIEPARGAEKGGVGVEHLEIVEMRPLQRRKHAGIILVPGAAAEHGEAVLDALVEIGDHAAEVMRDDVERGMAVEEAGEGQPRHR